MQQPFLVGAWKLAVTFCIADTYRKTNSFCLCSPTLSALISFLLLRSTGVTLGWRPFLTPASLLRPLE